MVDLNINGGSQTLDGPQTYDYINITNGGILNITPYNGTGTTGTLILNAIEVNVDSMSTINGYMKGYRGGAGSAAYNGGGHGGEGPGAGGTNSNCGVNASSPGGGGGGYSTTGGSGGNASSGCTGGSGGAMQGTTNGHDIAMGSGAGGGGGSYATSGTSGNAGGGMLTINTTLDTNIFGTINLNGGVGGVGNPSNKGGGGGGAAGGGLLISARNVNIINSNISALGGAGGGGVQSGKTGGNGRVKIFYSGTYNNTGATISAGTVYVEATTSPTGNLTITSTPSGARIYIGNIDQGVDTPNTISDLTTGNHNVKLVLINYDDYTTTVTIDQGQTTTITPTLTLSPGMTRVQASPSFVQPSFSGDIIDIGTLKFSWNGTGTVILEKTIVYDRLVLTGPNGTFDHTWTPCGAIVPEGPFDITNIFSQGYNEINVKIYNVCGGNIGTTTGSIDITGPVILSCPIAPKYSGDTITLQATPRDGIGPYYVEFSKDGILADSARLGGPNPIYNVVENTTITRTYVLTDEDVRNALTGTIAFSVFISDSCPTEAKTCTQECVVEIGCIPPVCNFTVT